MSAYRVCRRCNDAFYPIRASHWLCRACWKREHDRRRSADLDAATLKAAAALTHPDRQPPERREEAERITKALLGAREDAS
jgi:hypothetical protein